MPIAPVDALLKTSTNRVNLGFIRTILVRVVPLLVGMSTFQGGFLRLVLQYGRFWILNFWAGTTF